MNPRILHQIWMALMATKLRKWGKIIVVNLLVVLAILGGMEWYLAAQLNDIENAPEWLKPTLSTYYQRHDMAIVQLQPTMARHDTGLWYTLRPGQYQFTNREFDNTFHVNSMGLRDDEASLDYPEIIALGDSYTMGWGVDQDSSYAELLEDQLGIKVLNTGITSYGTAREFTMLKRLKTDSLKYLIIQYCPNDKYENQNYAYKGYFQPSSKHLYDSISNDHVNNISYFPFKHIYHVPGLYFGNHKVAPTPPDPTDTARTIGAIEAFIAVIADLDKSDHIGKDVQIIVFALEAERFTNGFITQVSERLQGAFGSRLQDRMSFIDLSNRMDTSHRYILDVHINTKGHKEIAKAIIEHLNTLPKGPEKRFWMYDNGADTAITAHYLNGAKHGVFTAFWENGVKSRTTTYVNGSKHGLEVDFYKNGTVKSRRRYERDNLTGTEWHYDAMGKVTDTLSHDSVSEPR